MRVQCYTIEGSHQNANLLTLSSTGAHEKSYLHVLYCVNIDSNPGTIPEEKYETFY